MREIENQSHRHMCVCVYVLFNQQLHTYERKVARQAWFFPYYIQAVRVYVYCVWPFYDGHTLPFFLHKGTIERLVS